MAVRKIRRRREEAPEEKEKPRSFEEPSLPGRIDVVVDQGSQVQALAYALEDPKARARLIALGVSGDDFSLSEYFELWKIVEYAHEKGIELDQGTVAALVDDPNLVGLAQGIRVQRPPDANLLDVVERLRWNAGVKLAAESVPAFAELIRKRSRPEETLKAARAIVQALDGARPYGRRHASNEEAVARRVEAIRLRRIAKKRYPFGLDGFDVDESYPEGTPKRYRTTVGAAPGKITVLTGLSGNGKSTVLANIVLAQIELGRRVLYGAWEDDQEDVLELLAAIRSGVNLTKLTVGDLDEAEEALVEEAMREISQSIVFMPNPLEKVRKLRYRNDEALDLIHSFIEESGAEFAVFDLWARAFSFASEQEEAEALYRQQAIGKATGCHCLLVQQQGLKTVEKREDPRPTREGTKGSGEWTGIADTMLGVFRQDLYKNVPAGKLEVIILKQRRGRWPLAVEFDFDPEFGRLSNGHAVAYEAPGTKAENSKNDLNRAISSRKKKGKPS